MVTPQDIDIADNTLPDKIRGTQSKLVDILGALIIILTTMPVFIIVIALAIVAYYFLMRLVPCTTLLARFYVSTTRQTKRLESVTRSPIYSHFSETLSGVTTVRAMAAVPRFVRENEEKVEASLRTSYSGQAASQWLELRWPS